MTTVRHGGGRCGAGAAARAWLVVFTAVAAFAGTAAGAHAQVAPSIAVTPGVGPAGTAVTLDGQGYLLCAVPGMAVEVTFADVVLAEVAPEVDGSFQATGTVPDVPAGTYDVVATCRAPDPAPGIVSASSRFEVVEVATGQTPPGVTEPPPADPPPADPPAADPTPEPTSAPSPAADPVPTTVTPAPAPVSAVSEPDVPVPADPGSTVEEDGPPEPVAAASPSPPVVEQPEPDPEPAAVEPWAVTAAIPTISEVEPTGESLLASALAIGLFVVLIGFPSVLFNGTFRRHYDRIVGGFRERFPRSHEVGDAVTARFPRLPLGAAALAGGSFALLLDPSVALDPRTLWLLAGLSGVAGVTSWLAWLPHKVRSERYGNDGHYRAYPAALFVAVGCVLVSRAAGFNPGYLYGLLFAYHLQGRWSQRDDGATFAFGFAAILTVGVGAWLTLPLVRAAEGAGGAAVALETFVVGLTLAGIEGVVLGMLPFTFTPGRVVWDWSRAAFLAVYVPGAAAFWMLLSGPDRALLGLDGMGGPSAEAVTAFLLWAGVSVSFWQYWRRRVRREQELVAAA